MKTRIATFLFLLLSAYLAWGQSSTLTINTSTGLINIPGGSAVPNFTALKIGGTTITLPAGSLVGTTATQTLTNKTLNGANNTITVRLADDVTGTLPVANGGTGKTSVSEVVKVLSADATAITNGTTGTTLTDIPGLSVNIGAGETWRFKLVLFTTQASGTPQIRYCFAGTQSVTVARFFGWRFNTDNYIFNGVTGSAFNSALASVFGGGDGNTSCAAVVEGVIVNAGSANTISVQLAQGISSADAIQAKAGSYVIATRVD